MDWQYDIHQMVGKIKPRFAVLSGVDKRLLKMLADLRPLRHMLRLANEGRCAWEVETAMRALEEARFFIKNAKQDEP